MRKLRPDEHQARLRLVRDVSRRHRSRMDPCELATLTLLVAQPLSDLLVDDIVANDYCSISGETSDCWLERVPVAVAVRVEVRRLAGKPPQRVSERRRRLAR